MNCAGETIQCSSDGIRDAQASFAAATVCHDARVEWIDCQRVARFGDGGQDE
jgi:hypothetical protein